MIHFLSSSHRRVLGLAGCALLVAISLGGIATLLFSRADAAPRKVAAAVVVSFKGKLAVKVAGSTKFAPANKGQFLYEQDVVRTEKDSLAAIAFVSGVQVKVNANTEFTISAKKLGQLDEEVMLNRGQAYSKIMRKGSKFGMKTPVAVASVRGTEFDVEYNPGKIIDQRVSVLEGVVELGNEYGKVFVNAGQYATVNGGEAPQPPQDMGPGDKPQWQEKLKVTDKDVKELDQQLQGQTGSSEKTLTLEVETPEGRKTLHLKFKK